MNTNENYNKTKESNISTVENQKRRDPKSMSLDELEAILSKTKSKVINDNRDENNSNKGLNNSQYSQKNYSFYEPQKYKFLEIEQIPVQSSNNFNNIVYNQNENKSERNILINSQFSTNFKVSDKNITSTKEVCNLSVFSEPVSDNEEKMTRNNLKVTNDNLFGNSSLINIQNANQSNQSAGII